MAPSLSFVKRTIAGSSELILATAQLCIGLVLIVLGAVEIAKGRDECIIQTLPWLIIALGSAAVLAACPACLFLAMGIYSVATFVIMTNDNYYRVEKRAIERISDKNTRLASSDIINEQISGCDKALLRAGTVALIVLWDLLAIRLFVLLFASVNMSERLTEYRRSFRTCFRSGRQSNDSIISLPTPPPASILAVVSPAADTKSEVPAQTLEPVDVVPVTDVVALPSTQFVVKGGQSKERSERKRKTRHHKKKRRSKALVSKSFPAQIEDRTAVSAKHERRRKSKSSHHVHE